VFFAAPPWQGLPAGAPRSVPDVVADADPNTGILLFQADAGPPQPFGEGGTSMATPIWAAGTALINQARGAPSGNFVQLLYSLRNINAFHSPGSMTPPNNDFTHLGIGSFNLGALAGQLVPACAPRPNVGVSVVPGSGGTLQVTITANNSPGTATNRGGNQISSLQFGATTNGLIVTSSTPNGSAGNFTVTPPAGTTQTSFVVRAATAGQPVTVPLVVTDVCGPWSTFVGQGGAPSGSGGAPAAEPTGTAAGTPTPQPIPARSAAAALASSVFSSPPSLGGFSPALASSAGSLAHRGARTARRLCRACMQRQRGRRSLPLPRRTTGGMSCGMRGGRGGGGDRLWNSRRVVPIDAGADGAATSRASC